MGTFSWGGGYRPWAYSCTGSSTHMMYGFTCVDKNADSRSVGAATAILDKDKPLNIKWLRDGIKISKIMQKMPYNWSEIVESITCSDSWRSLEFGCSMPYDCKAQVNITDTKNSHTKNTAKCEVTRFMVWLGCSFDCTSQCTKCALRRVVKTTTGFKVLYRPYNITSIVFCKHRNSLMFSN